LSKFQVILIIDDSMNERLRSIQPGSEITIHTNDGSYYEATFKHYDRRKKHVNIHIDRFYPNGGKDICLDKQEIVSVQTPDSIDQTEEEIE